MDEPYVICPDCWGVGELAPMVTCPRCDGDGEIRESELSLAEIEDLDEQPAAD